MYNGILKIEEVIRYIEETLLTGPDCDRMAAIMSLSVYEFRRIFAFIIGCPVSEYIRKRKLTLAALEIVSADRVDLLEISEKYGYANQSAFSRAFHEHHGMSPSACITQPALISIFTRPSFQFDMAGAESIPFRIIRESAFHLRGFCGVSEITDTCCCENVWQAFYESGEAETIRGEHIYAAYNDQGGNVSCCIGEPANAGLRIPASRWACFSMYTTDDDMVNAEYAKILCDWLPSANFKRNPHIPSLEVYPVDMSRDGFRWEIRIPIEQEEAL